jgi:EamA domain-containing membrane protein RarD
VFLYRETFDHTHLVGFSIIWLALLVFSGESLLERHRTLASAAT